MFFRPHMSAAVKASENGMERSRYQGGLDRNFCAKWPSVTAQARHYRFLFLDVLLVAYSYFILRSYGMAGEDAGDMRGDSKYGMRVE